MLSEKIGLRENIGEIDVVNQQWGPLGRQQGMSSKAQMETL